MSHIVRKDGILRKIIDRFELKTLEREDLTVPSEIHLTSDIDRYMNDLKPIEKYEETDYAVFKTFSVPAGKRWIFVAAWITRAASAEQAIQIIDPENNTIDLVREATATQTYWNGKDIELYENWGVKMVSSGAGSDATDMYIMYREETAF